MPCWDGSWEVYFRGGNNWGYLLCSSKHVSISVTLKCSGHIYVLCVCSSARTGLTAFTYNSVSIRGDGDEVLERRSCSCWYQDTRLQESERESLRVVALEAIITLNWHSRRQTSFLRVAKRTKLERFGCASMLHAIRHWSEQSMTTLSVLHLGFRTCKTTCKSRCLPF